MGETRPVDISSLKKGSYVVIDGVASVVFDTKTSRPGKHGHAKVNLTATGMLDGKKRNIVMPGGHSIDVPIIDKRNAQVLSVSGNIANVMDSESYETLDLEIPADVEGVESGVVVVYWVILDDRVIKQVKADTT